MKNCIVYHYFEKDESYKDNFNHFLFFGLDEINDFIIIVSGVCSLDIPIHKKNIKVFNLENFNLDYGAYCKLIQSEFHIHDYEFIFFINSSVRGPFIPPYIKETWTNIFINFFNSNVGAVGSTINILNPLCEQSLHYNKIFNESEVSHIQTTAYCLSRESLQLLIDCGFYNENSILDKISIISKYEIRMSQILLNNGYQIRSICPEFNKIDFIDKHTNPNQTSSNGDILVDKGYWGRTPHPYETIFVKTNRNLFNLDYLDRLSYSMLMAKSNDINDDFYTRKITDKSNSNKKINITPLTLDLNEFLNLIKNISRNNQSIKKMILNQVTDE